MPGPIAILLGGGIESTHLTATYLAEGRSVIPVHINTGLIWDAAEAQWCHRFCQTMAQPRLAPLIEIALPWQGFLDSHWAITGKNVPLAGVDSADLEIPLRNLTLLGFALHRLKSRADVGEIAIGTTADNHYCDGSREYFDACERVLSLEAARPIRIRTPLIALDKSAIIRQSDRQTLRQSFSCVHPLQPANQHCGTCIKCGRRQEAFRTAGVDDPTHYANS